MVTDDMAASEYLNQLLQDKTTITKMPKIFLHAERLLDEEINKVRHDLFSPSSFLLSLPAQNGAIVKLTEKIYAPVKDYPKFNFVGRIIGPRGFTLRQVETETGCKILVRGRGSMKDKKVEEEKRGQPNYEHLEEDLHVLIMVEDTDDRARLRLAKAVDEIKILMTPPEDGEDDIKRKQLKDLAMLNGTLRPEPSTPAPVSGQSSFPPSPSVQNGILSSPLPPMIPSYPIRTAGEMENLVYRLFDMRLINQSTALSF
eukprot:gene278-903_t